MSQAGIATYIGKTFNKAPHEIGRYVPGDNLVIDRKYIIRGSANTSLSACPLDFIGQFKSSKNKNGLIFYIFRILWIRSVSAGLGKWIDFEYNKQYEFFLEPDNPNALLIPYPRELGIPRAVFGIITRAYEIEDEMQDALELKSPETICQESNATQRTGLLCMIRNRIPAELAKAINDDFLVTPGGRKNKKSKKRYKRRSKRKSKSRKIIY